MKCEYVQWCEKWIFQSKILPGILAIKSLSVYCGVPHKKTFYVHWASFLQKTICSMKCGFVYKFICILHNFYIISYWYALSITKLLKIILEIKSFHRRFVQSRLYECVFFVLKLLDDLCFTKLIVIWIIFN